VTDVGELRECGCKCQGQGDNEASLIQYLVKQAEVKQNCGFLLHVAKTHCSPTGLSSLITWAHISRLSTHSQSFARTTCTLHTLFCVLCFLFSAWTSLWPSVTGQPQVEHSTSPSIFLSGP